MRIDRLMLHGVGPFDDLDIAFPASPDPARAEVHMFVGPNGSGKSTILYALAQLFGEGPPLDARFHDRESYAIVGVDGGYTAILRPGVVPSEQLGAQIGPCDPVNLASVTLWDGRHPGNARLRAYRHRRDTLPEHGLSFAAFTYAGSRTISPYRLRAIEELKQSPLDKALFFTDSSDSNLLVQWIANTKTKEALALARNDKALALRRARAIERIEDAIRGITDQEFHFVLNDDPLEVKILQNRTEVTLDVLPDELKSIMSWIADLLMRLDRIPWEDDIDTLDRVFFLFLDEIEIHLHPAWQRKVLPTVQRLFPNAQIFLSTHSPFVVGSVSNAWVHPLTVTSGKATARESLPSRAGDSYLTILDEVFGIDTEFDTDTEHLFERFHALKRPVMVPAMSVACRSGDIRSVRWAGQLRPGTGQIVRIPDNGDEESNT